MISIKMSPGRLPLLASTLSRTTFGSIMLQADLDQIRARAYELWEQARKPEGRIDEFWFQAEQQLKEERVRHELKTPDTL
jgi:hypothetical protein